MVTFRPLTEDDFGAVSTWLRRDHVRRWWSDPSTPDAVAAKYGPRIRGDEPTEVFVVSDGGVDVGIIQRYRIADHLERLTILGAVGFDATAAAGIDYLIGEPDRIGRGVGTETIRAFTEQLFAELTDVTCVTVTPQAANTASCRVLEKAGYRLAWSGDLESDDPSDEGESALYVRER